MPKGCIYLRQLFTDIRRSVFSFRWLAAALLIAGAVLAAVLTDSTYIETMRYFRLHGGTLDPLFAHTVMAKALTNDMLLACLPIAAALPFSTAVIEDVKSGYIKQYLPLVSKRSYAVSKLCSCALASMLAVTVGLGLVYFGIYAYHMPLQAAFELAEQQKAAAELLKSNIFRPCNRYGGNEQIPCIHIPVHLLLRARHNRGAVLSRSACAEPEELYHGFGRMGRLTCRDIFSDRICRYACRLLLDRIEDRRKCRQKRRTLQR